MFTFHFHRQNTFTKTAFTGPLVSATSLAAWTWGFVRKQRVTSLASTHPERKQPRSSVPTVPDTLSWPLLASVKILATVRDADAAATQAQDSQSGMKRMRFVVVEAEEQDLKQEATQPLLSLLQALTQIPPSTDALVTARLSELMTNSFPSGAKGCGRTPSRLTSNIISRGASGCGRTPGRFP